MNAAAVLLLDVDDLHVRRLGIDKHRYRSVRWYRDEHGGWRRVEPWMSTIRERTAGRYWGSWPAATLPRSALAELRSPAWRDRIEVVAIDPSAAFRRAIVDALPQGAGFSSTRFTWCSWAT